MKIKYAMAVALLAGASLAHGQQSAVQFGGANAAAGSQSSAGSFSGSGAGASASGITLEQEFQAGVIPSATSATITTHTDVSGKTTVRTAPTIGVPNIFPTAPCMGSSSLGVSVVGTGVAGGTSWVYENCEHRENSRLLHAMGMIPAAQEALCMQSTMAAHSMCKQYQKKAEIAPVPVAYVDPRNPKVTTQSDQMKADQLRTKSRDDAAFTQAALKPTEREQKEARCAYAKQIGDTILQSRFECMEVTAGLGAHRPYLGY